MEDFVIQKMFGVTCLTTLYFLLLCVVHCSRLVQEEEEEEDEDGEGDKEDDDGRDD